jgi:hypothetical protein
VASERAADLVIGVLVLVLLVIVILRLIHSDVSVRRA